LPDIVSGRHNGLAPHQANFPLPLEGCSPAIEARPANPKIPTGLGNVAYLLGVPESPQLALSIAVDIVHRSHPSCPIGFQKDVSQVRTYLHGAFLGAWLSRWNEQRKQRLDFARQQLSEFYSPMLSLRTHILFLTKLRVRIEEMAYEVLLTTARRHLLKSIESKPRRPNRLPIFFALTMSNSKCFSCLSTRSC
jgi:hypothetical protein